MGILSDAAGFLKSAGTLGLGMTASERLNEALVGATQRALVRIAPNAKPVVESAIAGRILRIAVPFVVSRYGHKVPSFKGHSFTRQIRQGAKLAAGLEFKAITKPFAEEFGNSFSTFVGLAKEAAEEAKGSDKQLPEE